MLFALSLATLVVAADPAPASPVLEEPVTVTRGQLLTLSLHRDLVYVAGKDLQLRPALSSTVTRDKQTGRLVWLVELKDSADLKTVKRDMANRIWLGAMAAAQTKVPLTEIVKSGRITDATVAGLIGSVDAVIVVDGKVASRGGLDAGQIAWRD